LSTVINPTVYPQDKHEAGRAFWKVLFNIGAGFPDHPSRNDKQDTHNLIKSIISRFTCQECIDHAFEFMRKHPADLDNKESLVKWLCRLKNNANEHEGKEIINCDEFIKNSINKEAGCNSCTVEPVKAPGYNIYATPIRKEQPAMITVPAPTPSPTVIPMPKIDQDFETVLNWSKRYPSMRRSMTVVDQNTSITPSVDPAADTSMSSLEHRYPSLSTGFGDEYSSERKQQELDGILKTLDPIYQGPASFMGITAQEMNLAYTPELLSNGVSLLTQIYMTNFGSLASSILSSLGLVAVSIFAKNSLSHYDKLLVQNTAASMIFHTLNFLNPRIKDEIVPDGQKFLEGVTSMNVEKIKESLLYNNAEHTKKNNAQEMIDILEGHANAKIDMDGLDLRGTHGRGASGGALTHDEVSKLLSGSSAGKNKSMYSGIGESQDSFSHILENSLLG
jgi:FAD-linked sulfhydryl oxidase